MLTYTFKKGSDTAIDIKAFPYTWGGQSRTFAVHVEKSTGLIGKPSLKSVENFDWKYLHGTTPDLSHRRYQDKEITLSCWMEGESKQQLVERLDKFMYFFDYDKLMLMKITWDTDNDNGGVAPNPHVAKGLFALVWLKGISEVRHKWRRGKNIIKFKLTFVDPYPVKRIYRYSGEDGLGVIYDIVSETEIDLFTDNGDEVYDITNEIGVINCPLNSYIIVCGDAEHATPSRPMFVPSNPMVRVQYLESSGNQFIDTGIVPTNETGIKVWFERIASVSGFFIGVMDTSENSMCIGCNNSSFVSARWGDSIPGDGNAFQSGNIELNYKNSRNFVINKDGETPYSTAIGTLGFTPEGTIRIFACGGARGEEIGGRIARILKVQITQGSDIIRDYEAVRIGSVGYLYDQINGTLKGNDGTDSFILGNDVSPVAPIDWFDPNTYTEPVDPADYTYPNDIITPASSRDTVTMIYAEI